MPIKGTRFPNQFIKMKFQILFATAALFVNAIELPAASNTDVEKRTYNAYDPDCDDNTNNNTGGDDGYVDHPNESDDDSDYDDDDDVNDYKCNLKGRPRRIRTRTVTFRQRWTRVRIRRFRLVCKNGQVVRKMLPGHPKYHQYRTRKGQKIGGRRVRTTFKIFKNGHVKKTGPKVIIKGKGIKH